MTDRAERWSTWLSFVITLGGLVGAIAFISYLLNSSTSLEITKLQIIPTYLPERFNKSDLLLLPSGDPVVAIENSANLDVFTWKLSADGEYHASKIAIPFGQLIGGSSAPLMAPFTGATSRPSIPTPGLPYAISDDASMIAWSWGGYLFAGPPSEPRKIQRLLTVPTTVVDISFLNSDLVAILHSSGELFLERLSQRDPNLPGTRVAPSIPPREPWRISGKGPLRLLSRLGTSFAILIDPNGKKKTFQKFPISEVRSFITTSPQGQVAIGTSTGMLFFPRPFGEAPFVVLPEARKVQAIAFYDEQHVIASLEGGSLFMVEDQERVRRLDTAPDDVKLMAVQGSKIVMATARSISTGSLERHLKLSDLSKWKLALTFSILGLLGFLRLWVLDVINLVDWLVTWLDDRRRQAETQKEQATQSGGEERPETEPSPVSTDGEQEQPPL